jgi:RNA polymerase sigma-70 factor (subfamily 1)
MADAASASDWPITQYRHYLRILADARVSPLLQGKVDGSDVAQEAILRAYQKRDQCHAETEEQRLAWLRCILANTAADMHRRFSRGKRDAALEQSLEEAFERSSFCLRNLLADRPAPVGQSSSSEPAVRLANALAKLPDSQRFAVTLRYLRDPPVPLAEIGKQLGRTEKAAAGLVSRGLQTLRNTLAHFEDS